uniref:Uncharacterized protein n=1 Tax=Fagus sylvatica TaxID=28930 RepID=A0A2N9IYE3_FAGSY
MGGCLVPVCIPIRDFPSVRAGTERNIQLCYCLQPILSLFVIMRNMASTGQAVPIWSPASTGQAVPIWSSASTGQAVPIWSPASTGQAVPIWSSASTGQAVPIWSDGVAVLCHGYCRCWVLPIDFVGLWWWLLVFAEILWVCGGAVVAIDFC